jgi:hypothetical protein
MDFERFVFRPDGRVLIRDAESKRCDTCKETLTRETIEKRRHVDSQILVVLTVVDLDNRWRNLHQRPAEQRGGGSL